jgi:hypothetical protein
MIVAVAVLASEVGARAEVVERQLQRDRRRGSARIGRRRPSRGRRQSHHTILERPPRDVCGGIWRPVALLVEPTASSTAVMSSITLAAG